MALKKILSTFLILGMASLHIYAQQSGNTDEGVITGKIVDSEGTPAPSASVAVYDSSMNNIITGASSDTSGGFSIGLKPGTYVVRITYVSFRPHRERVRLKAGETKEFGTITLQPASERLEEIVVEGERSQLAMSFDRRVFRVGTDITSMGGSVLDVLDNVPSVTTDIEGNVSLRGSDAVRILINGKPSNLVQNDTDGLRSIPANMVERVEVITNPSSRYEAEGSAGIINIVLKKEQALGLNGSVSAGTGIPADHELSANLNYRINNINWFLGGGINYREDPGSGNSFQRFSSPDTAYMYRESTESVRSEIDGNLRFGADIYMSGDQTLTASASLNLEDEEDETEVRYTDLTLAGDIMQEVFRDQVEQGNESDYEFRLEYENLFEGEDHRLTADIDLDFSREREHSDLEEVIQAGNTDPLFQRTDNEEEERDIRFQADYVRPVGENNRLEAGLFSSAEWMDNTFVVEELQNGIWQPLDEAFNDNFLYYENVNAAYAIFASDRERFSYQAGLRAEHTNTRTELKRTGQVNDRSYIDLFPSLFFTYKLNDLQSLQISYSRRLQRPWSRMLLPFSDYSDSRNRFTGNPDLEPEFSNSYEAGFMQYWQTGSLLASLYYRRTTGEIERITILDSEGITRIFPINLSTEDAWGLELTADQEIADALSLTGSANLYRSNSEGVYQDQILSGKTNAFYGRLGIRWQISDKWNYETSLWYAGPRETTQGQSAAMSSIDTGIARDLLDGRATISLNVRDLLDTRKRDFTVNDPNFYSEQEFRWSTRSFTINFTYRFNQDNSRDDRERQEGPEEDSFEGNFNN